MPKTAQSFQKLIDPFIWTHVIDNCFDAVEGDSDSNNNSLSIDKDKQALQRMSILKESKRISTH